ncbi:MAG: hypothetical protein AABZ39_02850, partial [Spirochaetota bacterium]
TDISLGRTAARDPNHLMINARVYHDSVPRFASIDRLLYGAECILPLPIETVLGYIFNIYVVYRRLHVHGDKREHNGATDESTRDYPYAHAI